MRLDKPEILKKNRDSAIAEIPRLAYEFRYMRRKRSLAGLLSHIASDHEWIGTYDGFVNNDIAGMKQNYYVSSRLASLEIEYLSEYETRFFSPRFLYAMLSDNQNVINAYAYFEPGEYVLHRNKPNSPQFQAHMYQLALRDEHEALRRKIEIAAQKGGKKIREDFSEESDFYSLFLNRDKIALESLILKKAKLWERSLKKGSEMGTPVTSNLLAAGAMEHAKLCWLKGIEVEIDHPLIPMELLPVRPLEHYDDVYDFLNPNWQPPPQGFLDKFAKLFGM